MPCNIQNPSARTCGITERSLGNFCEYCSWRISCLYSNSIRSGCKTNVGIKSIRRGRVRANTIVDSSLAKCHSSFFQDTRLHFLWIHDANPRHTALLLSHTFNVFQVGMSFGNVTKTIQSHCFFFSLTFLYLKFPIVKITRLPAIV